MNKRLAIIDADSLPYLCSRDSIDSSLKNIDSIIADILKQTGCQYYVLVLSKPPYFRHKINPEYKQNRVGVVSPLKHLSSLKAYLYYKYAAFDHLGLEADDLVGWIRSELEEEYQCVICAMDKDVIGQLIGTHYNYRARQWITTSKKDADEMLLMQWLSGDPTDNIKGLTGVGKVKAKKMVESIQNTDYLLSLLQFYRKEFSDIQALEQMVINYRQVYILKDKRDIIEVIGEEMCPKIGDVVINQVEIDKPNEDRQ